MTIRKRFTKNQIIEALSINEGKTTRAAKHLNISPSTFKVHLAKHNVVYDINKDPRAQREKQDTIDALNQNDQVVSHTAKFLDISQDQLYSRILRHRIETSGRKIKAKSDETIIESLEVFLASSDNKPTKSSLDDPSSINWPAVAVRLRGFRYINAYSVAEIANLCELNNSVIWGLETGIPAKSTSHLKVVINAMKINSQWLLEGIGKYYEDTPVEYLPETLVHTRGAGINKPKTRAQAESGELSDDQFEFLLAIDAYKAKNKRTFPSWTEVLEVFLCLGYKKNGTPTINPMRFYHEKAGHNTVSAEV